MPTRLVKAGISLVVLAIITVSFYFFQKQVNMNLQMIENIQKHIGDGLIVRIYSDWMEIFLMYGPVFFFMLKTNQRARAFYYLTFMTFIALANNELKVIYKAPRPFWKCPGVKTLGDECAKGFGAPSGHTMFAWAVPAGIALDIRRSNPSGTLMIVIALIITVVLGTVEAWTRMVLGLHTLEQVAFGAVIGLWLAFTFEYCIRKDLMNHLMKLHQNKRDELPQFKTLAMCATGVAFLYIGSAMVVYRITIGSWTGAWTGDNQALRDCIIENCGENNYKASTYTFARYQIPHFGMIGLAYGAYLGTLLQTQLFKGRSHFQGPTEKKLLKALARGFGLVLVLSIVEVYRFFDHDDNLIIKLFFQVFFPTTIMTFIAFGLMDESFFKLKLYDPDE